MSLIPAFLKGLEDALSPPLRAILWRVLFMGLALTLLLVAGAYQGLGFAPSTGWGWLDETLRILGGILTGIGLAFMFPVMMTTLQSLFLDEAAAKVAARDYPADPPGRDIGFVEGTVSGLRFLAVTIALNILFLPLQIAGIFLPLLNLLVFLGLNGYLVGREYFEQVALRQASPAEATRLRRANRLLVFSAGLLGTALMVVPVVNLIAPLVTLAAMVHLERGVRLSRRGG
ncbi:EI24 domain-containing protein [Zavarzinia aquatilis]|uniref:Cysteine biosynthesis protein CysZ n=1 Tax=Zavarzinia aquatilis TaxID=2211142 RepID=A0A317EB43_9PROT|nr:EI24 domain-containing protein [Zavarzinia aquatilis]PWR22513.1 cysteine biosynthesis protein CysZ [Zavarzinia aquatilis]